MVLVKKIQYIIFYKNDLFTLHYIMIFVTYIHEYGDLNRGEIIKTGIKKSLHQVRSNTHNYKVPESKNTKEPKQVNQHLYSRITLVDCPVSSKI